LPSRGYETFGQVVGGVIHDVNGLLSIAQRSAGKLRELLPDDPDAHDRLEAIETAVKRATALNRGLLEGRTAGDGKPSTDVAERLVRLAELLAGALKEGVDLTTSIEPALPPAAIEPYELDRIVTNLVRNACDAVTAGGRIEISARAATVEGRNDLELEPGSYDWLVRRRAGAVRVMSRPRTSGTLFEVFLHAAA